MPKERLDQLLVQRGHAETREKAQRLIRTGRVRVRSCVESKPGKSIDPSSPIQIEKPDPYVSRGGEKLREALSRFYVDCKGHAAIDVGASTGGFTDCLLQYGADRVYAIDVGYGQLHWKLRKDPRVVVMETMNARYLKPGDLPEIPDLAVVDVSFISLTRILPALVSVLAEQANLITLIKPQFEAGRKYVGKGGVVRDRSIHEQVIEKIRKFGTYELQLSWMDVCESPLRGPAGNIEFFSWWKRE